MILPNLQTLHRIKYIILKIKIKLELNKKLEKWSDNKDGDYVAALWKYKEKNLMEHLLKQDFLTFLKDDSVSILQAEKTIITKKKKQKQTKLRMQVYQ